MHHLNSCSRSRLNCAGQAGCQRYHDLVHTYVLEPFILEGVTLLEDVLPYRSGHIACRRRSACEQTEPVRFQPAELDRRGEMHIDCVAEVQVLPCPAFRLSGKRKRVAGHTSGSSRHLIVVGRLNVWARFWSKPRLSSDRTLNVQKRHIQVRSISWRQSGLVTYSRGSGEPPFHQLAMGRFV